jgi:hypothetical protein
MMMPPRKGCAYNQADCTLPLLTELLMGTRAGVIGQARVWWGSDNLIGVPRSPALALLPLQSRPLSIIFSARAFTCYH